MRTAVLACVLIAGSIACSSPSHPDDPNDELANNQQQFQSTVGDSYRVTYENNCFCPVETLRPVRITVRNGAIAEITHVSDGSSISPAEWNAYRTVDQVFSEIAAGFKNGARRVFVDYDSRYGYPRSALIDYQMAADNFVGFKLSDLEALH